MNKKSTLLSFVLITHWFLANPQKNESDPNNGFEFYFSIHSDTMITPKKDSVSLIRKKQFAFLKPATKKRIDSVLKLKDKPTTERLQHLNPFGLLCTHRIVLTTEIKVNPELLDWLREAYQGAS